MPGDAENHTSRLLQEMRQGVEDIRSDIRAMREEITDLTQRVDGNTLTFNLVAGVVYNHEGRIDALEQGRA